MGWNGSDCVPAVSFKALCTFALSRNLIIAMWEQAQGSLLKDERASGGELNYPNLRRSRVAYSHPTPNMWDGPAKVSSTPYPTIHSWLQTHSEHRQNQKNHPADPHTHEQ